MVGGILSNRSVHLKSDDHLHYAGQGTQTGDFPLHLQRHSKTARGETVCRAPRFADNGWVTGRIIGFGSNGWYL